MAARKSSQRPRTMFGLWIMLYLVTEAMFALVAPRLGGGRLAVANVAIEKTKPMSPKPSGVMAAPNKCRIKARVLQVEQHPRFRDKWQFTLEVLESQSVEGPNFARVGERVRAFTIAESSGLPPADITLPKHHCGYRGVSGRCQWWHVPADEYPDGGQALRPDLPVAPEKAKEDEWEYLLKKGVLRR